MRELAGKAAFVTGGASGIGLALGRTFAQAGMDVMLADIETDALTAAIEGLRDIGPRVCGIATVDVKLLTNQRMRRKMAIGSTMALPHARNVLAPDGSEVRILLSLAAGSMAHFQLRPGQVSQAVRHRTVEEIWYVLSGQGEMWQSAGEQDEDILPLSAGICLTIPVGTRFQFRSVGDKPLAAVAVTMPPWPGDGEAALVEGKWEPTTPSLGIPRTPDHG